MLWTAQLKNLPLGKDGIPGSRHPEDAQLERPQTRHRASLHLKQATIEMTVVVIVSVLRTVFGSELLISHFARRSIEGETVLLKRSVNACMLLDILQGIRRTAKRFNHCCRT